MEHIKLHVTVLLVLRISTGKADSIKPRVLGMPKKEARKKGGEMRENFVKIIKNSVFGVVGVGR